MTNDADKDAEVLARLLREYTESLGKVIGTRSRWDTAARFNFWGVTITTVVATASMMLGTKDTRLREPWMGISFVIVLAGLVLAMRWLSSPKTPRRRALDEDIELFARKLEKIVRRASQTLDHGKPSFGVELELDLRLTEAESALRKAHRLVKFSTRGPNDPVPPEAVEMTERARAPR